MNLISKWFKKKPEPMEETKSAPLVSKTIYPNWEKGNDGSPTVSPNGTGEFYGLIEMEKDGSIHSSE